MPLPSVLSRIVACLRAGYRVQRRPVVDSLGLVG
jgi:hypothetical protein